MVICSYFVKYVLRPSKIKVFATLVSPCVCVCVCMCVYVRVCVLGCEKFGSVQNLLIVLLNGKKVEAIEDEICES